MIIRSQVAHVKAERDILAEAELEWVTKLYYSFQDKENLYFILEYIPGGDLMTLLIKKGIFKEPLAMFYIAELVVAIESLHKMGFIHRYCCIHAIHAQLLLHSVFLLICFPSQIVQNIPDFAIYFSLDTLQSLYLCKII